MMVGFGGFGWLCFFVGVGLWVVCVVRLFTRVIGCWCYCFNWFEFVCLDDLLRFTWSLVVGYLCLWVCYYALIV